MTGPPTPPITSEIEIQDAERTAGTADAPAASGSTPAPAAPEPVPVRPEAAVAAQPAPAEVPAPVAAVTPYRQAAGQLAELAVAGKFEELVEVAEVIDLSTVQDAHLDRLLLTTPLALSYLILDNSSAAIHSVLRLPDLLKAHPIPQALFRLAASVSERKYGNVYPRARELSQIVQGNADLQNIVNGLLTRFLDVFRLNTLVLLSKAYSSIPLSLAQSYLECTPEQVLAEASRYKWGYDASTQVLTPVPLPKNAISPTTGAPYGQSTLATIDLIVNTNLE